MSLFTYTWRNVETGEIVTVPRKLEDCNIPPGGPGNEAKWERVYTEFFSNVWHGGKRKKGDETDKS